MKKALIISWNTIPVEDKTIPIAATGMRSYKLALGLLENGFSTVDVATKNYELQMGRATDKRVNIVLWETEDQVAELANKYDVVIISSNLEDRTPHILNKVNNSVIKVVDAFIPLYFEEAMREEVSSELSEYHVRKLSFLHASLQCADYILVANTNQKLMYLGAFGAVNMLNFNNFAAYKDNFIINYPGVIDEPIPSKNPYDDYKNVIKGRKIVLWFGSTYQWFNISPLLAAYKSKSKLTNDTVLFVVGAKNPNFASGLQRNDDIINDEAVIFIPWVDYTDRLAWMTHADVGVSINKITAENSFSFRNRLLDLAQTGLPLITNGQDPLGEEIISLRGGLRFEEGRLADTILGALETKQNADLRKGMHRVREQLDNTACNAVLAKRLSARGERVLNQDYLMYPYSDIASIEKLLATIRWGFSHGSPGVRYLRANTKAVEQLDDVLQFVSTKEIINTTKRRLKNAVASKARMRK